MSDIDHFVSNGQREDNAVQLLQKIYDDAADVNASDVHFTHDILHNLNVKFFKDSSWFSYGTIPSKDISTIISKLRGRCNCSITDIQRPKDGTFTQRAKDKIFDVRTSFLPTANGVSIVCRLQESSKKLMSVDDIGMPDHMKDTYLSLLDRTEGGIYHVGPTGSGKTTSLYAGIKKLNRPHNHIITIEDPIDIRVDGIDQVGVGEGTGRTYASVLRASMRQRPNLIVVGEIREEETAKVAFQASQSGHLLLSSFHANSSTLAVLTLKQHGLDPYRIGASVLAIVAQRRVERICSNCSYARKPTASEEKIFSDMGLNPNEATVKEAAGCPVCANTGHNGMITLFEMLRISDFPDAVASVQDYQKLQKVAVQQPQYKSLSNEAIRYIYEGITSLKACSSIIWGAQDYMQEYI